MASKYLDLSKKDNKQIFMVHKGEEITVRLSGKQAKSFTWAWSAPTAANGTVLYRDVARTLPNGDATAVFHAKADGTTTLNSQFSCKPRKSGQACSYSVEHWQVTIKVRK